MAIDAPVWVSGASRRMSSTQSSTFVSVSVLATR